MLRDVQLDEAFHALHVRVDAFAICEIGEGYCLECEPHDQVLVHFALKGQGTLACEHGDYPLRPGSVTIVPPRIRKTLSGTGPIQHVSPARASCHPSDGIVRYSAGNGDADLLLGCAVLSAYGGFNFEAMRKPFSAQAHDASLQGLFAALLHEVREPREGTRAFLSAIMNQLLVVMFRSSQMTSPSAADLRLKRALDKILQNPLAPHSIQHLAEEAAMSRARFCSQFTKAYGTSPMAFVASVRLASAAQLLQTSTMPVKAVAAAIGYASRSQFSAAFHKKYGMGPLAFRRAS